MSIIISPSIASADPLRLGLELERAVEAGAQDIHVDIEDGNFVPNITFGIKTIRALRAKTSLPFSFHLMTTNPEQWLTDLTLFNPLIVFGHYEALPYPLAFIGLARQLGVRSGLAFNPRTPVEQLDYLIDKLDGILLLSAEPDRMGEHFLPSVLEKAKTIRSLSTTVELWLDGDLKRDQLPLLEEYGVTHAVMGREFFRV